MALGSGEFSCWLDPLPIPTESAEGFHSPVYKPVLEASLDSDIELQQLETTHRSSSQQTLVGYQSQEDKNDHADDLGPSRKLARSKLRWGVVQMPPEWHAEYQHEGVVEHLSFGVKDDNVQAPVPGRLYA
ncbi:hypothetical protein F4821DRAFT_265978 [Hypoxylon rubiginosum]|uniref:Uncharacterized protein n=1 Tax=Hypoxylon rubiginosum TaxID=110542 RepID=A0ACC0CIX2_9PEZI|nr:hypothetical protein F4821DRAFT_265978 [Hypoxylon rubiginosum]